MKKENIETLIYKIKCNVKESSNQNDLITEYHTRFNVTISYNNVTYNTDYQCNINYTHHTKENIIACILSDARCYADCKVNDDDIDNIEEFRLMFGYENIKELLKTYDGCKKAYNNIKKMFTNEEIKKLENYLEEKGLM